MNYLRTKFDSLLNAAPAEGLRQLVRQTDADELTIDCRIYDADARKRSHEYAAQAMGALLAQPAVFEPEPV